MVALIDLELEKHELSQYQPPILSAGWDNLQSQILKRGGQGEGGGVTKKMIAWGFLNSHRYFPGEAYYVSCQKRLCKMKYGFEGSIFKCQSWPVLAKKPMNF